mgnify:CR=1 FL=1
MLKSKTGSVRRIPEVEPSEVEELGIGEAIVVSRYLSKPEKRFGILHYSS